MKQWFIFMGWVCVAATSFASAADLRSLDEDAQFLVRVKSDYYLHDPDTNSSEKRTSLIPFDISDGDEEVQSSRSRDIRTCYKRFLCVGICTAGSLVASALIYTLVKG